MNYFLRDKVKFLTYTHAKIDGNSRKQLGEVPAMKGRAITVLQNQTISY